jgi:histidinol-phosphate aminotransferase
MDSKANFIFMSHPSVPAKELFGKLKDRGILVRYFNLPRIDNYLRVSIGTDEQMKKFCDAVEEIGNL